MNYYILKIISFLHTIFLLFVLLTPLTKSRYFLLMYAIFIPFLMLHWIVNNNICVLSLLEKQAKRNLYGEEYNSSKDCLTCKLIEPIYDFKENHKSKSILIYSITTLLWCVVITKLYGMWKKGEIKKYTDLFII